MKSHSIEVAFDPLYKRGPQENREKGNTLLRGEADYAILPAIKGTLAHRFKR